MTRLTRHIWRSITLDDDGRPLFGWYWAGPIMVGVGILVVISRLFS